VVVVTRRYQLDSSYRRFGTTLLAGSPLRVFRLGPTGEVALSALESGGWLLSAAVPLAERLVDAGALHPVPVSGSFSIEQVTLVTPTLNTAVTHLHRGPMVVVDDGSDVPPAYPPNAKVVRNATTRGPGQARNVGRQSVATPLIAFVDADVTLPDGWLDALLPHFDDPRCALVAPRVAAARGSTLLEQYECSHSPLDLGTQPARIAPLTRVGYVPAAAVVCRTDAFDAVGGFDTDLRYGEDVDLVWRLVAAGWRCRYEPASTVGHASRRTWFDWARQRLHYGSSAAPLAARHPRSLAPAVLSPWSLALWALVAARRPVAAAAVAVGTGLALHRKLPTVPAPTALSLVVHGHAGAGRQLASAARRAWWPFLVPLLVLRKTRPAALCVLIEPLCDARVRRAPQHWPLRVVDDLTYGLGVWRGARRQASWRALRPKVTGWPPARG
jgi:mycofactocin system glycosyltransferase